MPRVCDSLNPHMLILPSCEGIQQPHRHQQYFYLGHRSAMLESLITVGATPLLAGVATR
jgi:hypothetical protein